MFPSIVPEFSHLHVVCLFQVSYGAAAQTAGADQANGHQSGSDEHMRHGATRLSLHSSSPPASVVLLTSVSSSSQILIFSLALLIFPSYSPFSRRSQSLEDGYAPSGGEKKSLKHNEMKRA